MRRINVYLREQKKQEDHGIVWIMMYIQRQKVHFSTKVRCLKKDWSQKSMRVKRSAPHANDNNLIIENILARINTIEVKYRLKDKPLTTDIFWRLYNRPSDHENFYKYYEEYINRTRMTMIDDTIRIHKGVLKMMQEYHSDISFDDVTIEFLRNFFAWLKKKKGNNDATAYRKLGILKKYVRAAVREGYMDADPFTHFKIKRPKSKTLYLDTEELQHMVDLYRSNTLCDKDQKTLQFFLYMCFSSQHVSDALNMRIEQFTEKHFVYYRKKLRNTKPEPITIPICQPLRQIIDEVVQDRKNGLLWTDMLSEQKMNIRLKDIARFANIDKPISHKTARHTFATFYLDKTKDVFTLQKIMGHTNIEQTLVYAHVLEESTERGIACFNML